MTKTVKLKDALQECIGAYTFLRTEVSATPEADRTAVTASLFAAVAAIGLSAAELAELRTVLATAPSHAIHEPAIVENMPALLDLASELDDEERQETVVKLQALIDQVETK